MVLVAAVLLCVKQGKHKHYIYNMDNRSRGVLRRVAQNDSTFTSLHIGHLNRLGGRTYPPFRSGNSYDYSRLGTFIRKNTHLTELLVGLDDDALDVANRVFFDGLKYNSSIQCTTKHAAKY